MEHKLITNTDELRGLGYYEFFLGEFNKNQNKYGNNNSAYLTEGDVEIFLELIYTNIRNVRDDNNSYLNKEEINDFVNDLQILILEIEQEKETKCTNELFNKRINEDKRYTEDEKIFLIKHHNNYEKTMLRNYRNDILKMLNDLLNWLKLNNKNGISIVTYVGEDNPLVDY
jgi:hypothetical protein